MIVKILNRQIPQIWELIKFACVQADEVDKKEMPQYFNELLHALLNDKAQCFIRLDDDRTLLAVLITRIMIDRVTGEKYLFLQCLYSFKVIQDEVLRQARDLFVDFAKAEQCSYISFNSRHKRIWEIAEIMGFKEKHRRFDFEIGGV